MSEGLIYNIQRYCLHDGPGIRTVIFFKGCPLRCQWCANPESQVMSIENMGSETVGQWMGVEEVLKEALRDKVFFEHSGGGITISGGEPLMQDTFLYELLRSLKSSGIHIAIETSGYQQWEKIEKLIDYVDLFYYDLKVLDKGLHQEVTGAPNGEILENLLKLKVHSDVIIRIPVIPIVNMDFESLLAMCNFLESHEFKCLELLPYHRLGESKYESLGRDYELKGVKQVMKEELHELAERLNQQVCIEIKVV